MDTKAILAIAFLVLGWALREIYNHQQKKNDLSDKKIGELTMAVMSNTLVQQELKIETKFMRETFQELKAEMVKINKDLNALHDWKRSVQQNGPEQ
jgi:hypothetical protein